ncbi:MAG: O-antigen ligase family protein [Pirellulales bacterium]|nr:O-antigen ligase family protein [Pirellulales bacterium]
MFVFAVMISMSAWEKLRIPIPALNAHPYLIAMLPLFIYLFFTRLGRFPLSVLTTTAIFSTLYILSVFSSTIPYYQEPVKLLAGAGTMITAALAVTSRSDFRAGVVGLTVALVIMALKGLAAPSASYIGVDPLETSNENSWSLYNLPPLLLGGYMTLDKTVSKSLRIFCGTAFVIISISVLASANRSGWLGLAVVPPMLFLGRGKKIQTMLYFVLAAGLVFLVMEQLGMFDVVQHHMEATTEGKTTDGKRIQLLMASLQIGLEHPLLGVSPQELFFMLAHRVFGMDGTIDSHNVFAHVTGGSGYPAMFTLFLSAYLLWKRPSGVPSDFFGNERAASAHYIMKMMILMWGIRGFFSREILYSPVFCMGIGICIGWCVVEGVWKPADEQRSRTAGRQPRPGMRPVPGMRALPRRTR